MDDKLIFYIKLAFNCITMIDGDDRLWKILKLAFHLDD